MFLIAFPIFRLYGKIMEEETNRAKEEDICT